MTLTSAQLYLAHSTHWGKCSREQEQENIFTVTEFSLLSQADTWGEEMLRLARPDLVH